MNSSRVLQQRLWRWHFWAGLMSLPLALVLAISGAIYLFKPQYNQWQEHQLQQSLEPTTQQPLSADTLLASINQQHPNAHFKSYTLARNDDRTVEFELAQQQQRQVLWVDRYTANVLKIQPKQEQLMHWIKHLHGELTFGDRGSYLVELMAHWMIVLIISGLVLYLSRQRTAAQGHWGKTFKRALLPSLKYNTPLFWRRLHAAIGIWCSVFILILLISGLPWTQVWGNGFKQVQQWMGWEGPGQEWSVSLQSSPAQRQRQQHRQHHHDGVDLWQLSSTDTAQFTLQSGSAPNAARAISLGQIEEKIGSLALAHPVIIHPPKGKNGVWTVRSMTPNRPERVTLHFDRWSGEQLMRIDFDDYHPVKQLVSYGIALHEGALFGWLNQLLGLLTALGLIGIVCSGALMWWKRRPQGGVGVPPLIPGKLPMSLWISIAVLALVLPLFAASVIAIAAIDTVIVASRRLR